MTILSRLRAALSPARLAVPPAFNRNSSTVTSLKPPEEAGLWLLERMRLQIGFESYADKSVLDFGCGVRFTQAIINSGFQIGRYYGVDSFRDMIEFLENNVHDSRFAYYHLNAYHPLYNALGIELSAETRLPAAERTFDVVCMFSVITHQYPKDSRWIFTMLRRYVREHGHLFFTCFADEFIPTFEDRSAERNGGRCFYNPTFLNELVEGCGWRKVISAPSDGPLIADAFVYQAV
jgi:SAM-dependent methyltransferase